MTKAKTKTSKIQALDINVVVRPEVVEEKIGSIHLPDSHRDRQQHGVMRGTVVDVGPLAFHGLAPAATAKQGDLIIFDKYAGLEISEGGETFRIIRDECIVGKIRK